MGGITSRLQSRLLQAGELPRPSTGIGCRQNDDVMAFTARAFRTVFGVPPRSNSPLTGNLPISALS